jgi:hypothetical protein
MEAIMNTRYIAEWVKADNSPPGEFDPDSQVYGRAAYDSRGLAQREAIRLARTYNVTEWVRVAEETFNAELGIPKHSDAAWDVVRVWHGDWDGNWVEDGA